MDAAGVGYRRKANCFTHLADVTRAQALMDGQLPRTHRYQLTDKGKALTALLSAAKQADPNKFAASA